MLFINYGKEPEKNKWWKRGQENLHVKMPIRLAGSGVASALG